MEVVLFFAVSGFVYSIIGLVLGALALYRTKGLEAEHKKKKSE